jgi:phosphate transport system substrate-binding protein
MQKRQADHIDRMLTHQERMLDLISKLTVAPDAPSAPAATAPASQPIVQAVPAAAPAVSQTSPISGRLRSIGSDTMDKLMEYWQEGFRKQNPNVAFYHQGRGSSTAIPALMEGQADLGPMSREIKSSEKAVFKSKFGYDPAQLRVAIDTVGVYVHPDNPFAKQGLTFKQLDAVFSEACLRGGKKALTWGDLGLIGEWANAPIHVYIRNSASGTHAFFQSTVLTDKGTYSDRCKALPGSEELVDAIAKDRYGIGYSGIGYLTPAVAAVPLSVDDAGNVYPPEMQYAYTGEYPLTRFLYLAVNKDPAAELSPMTSRFIDYIFSDEGQAIVKKDGFYSVSSKIAAEEKAKIGL